MASRFPVPFSGGLGRHGFDPLTDLHREVNRLFEDAFGGAGPLAAVGGPQGGAMMSMPRLDVREGDKELCITAELPGVKESDVDLRIEGDMLTLSGEKRNEVDQQRENFHVMERSYGRFRRTIQLPFAPNPEQVQADFEQGVLTIRMPRQDQEQRSRRIEIRHAAGEESKRLQDAGQGGSSPGTTATGVGGHYPPSMEQGEAGTAQGGSAAHH